MQEDVTDVQLIFVRSPYIDRLDRCGAISTEFNAFQSK